jgi:hypothetical protein
MNYRDKFARITALCGAFTLAAALAGCGDVSSLYGVTQEGNVQTVTCPAETSASESTTTSVTTTSAETKTTTIKETTSAESSAPDKEITAADDNSCGYREYLSGLDVTSSQLSREEISCGKDTVTIRFTDVSGELELYMMKMGEEEFIKYPLEKDETGALAAELPFVGGDLAELRVVGEIDGETVRNEYFLDRSESTDKGYIFQSLDYGTEAYMNTDKENSFAVLTDNTRYEKDGMTALSQATFITAEDVSAFTGGEIYSVVSYEAPAERSTISWYKYSGGEWKALKTDLTEEHECIGVRADLNGEGLYVIFGVSK